MEYNAGETIVLKTNVTKDFADTLYGITASVDVFTAKESIVTGEAMTLDMVNSTVDMKIFYYFLSIPSTIEGRVDWEVTILGDNGHKTIEKETFYVRA